MRVFITGTDTNVGKTVISSWLVYHLKADYWKPIQSGALEGLDTETISTLTDASTNRLHPETYLLQAPLSPHLAATLEETPITIETIQIPQTDNILIAEGIGGVMVPLNTHQTVLDLIKHLGFPVLVVARSTLGTINHTCLTLETLRRSSIPILGVIMNGPHNPDNKAAIERFGKIQVLAELQPLMPLTKKTIAHFPLPPLLHQAIT